MEQLNPSPREPAGAAGSGRRRLAVGLAVLAAVAVAAGIIALVRGSRAPAVGPGDPERPILPDPMVRAAALPADALPNVVVRDGDRVRAIGSLEARPGKPL